MIKISTVHLLTGVHVSFEERKEELRGVSAVETMPDIDDGEGAEEDCGGGTCFAPRLRAVVIIPRRPTILHHGGVTADEGDKGREGGGDEDDASLLTDIDMC